MCNVKSVAVGEAINIRVYVLDAYNNKLTDEKTVASIKLQIKMIDIEDSAATTNDRRRRHHKSGAQPPQLLAEFPSPEYHPINWSLATDEEGVPYLLYREMLIEGQQGRARSLCWPSWRMLLYIARLWNCWSLQVLREITTHTTHTTHNNTTQHISNKRRSMCDNNSLSMCIGQPSQVVVTPPTDKMYESEAISAFKVCVMDRWNNVLSGIRDNIALGTNDAGCVSKLSLSSVFPWSLCVFASFLLLSILAIHANDQNINTHTHITGPKFCIRIRW